MSTPPQRRPRRHRGRSIAGVIVIAIVALVIFWDWNWFKPLAEARASAALDRRVTIGNLDVELGWRPWILLDDVVIANPPEMSEGTLGSVRRLSLHLNPWPLLRGRVVLPDLVIDRLRGDLRPGPSGTGNWVLGRPRQAATLPMTLDIGRLAIIDGSAHVLDPARQADFSVLLHTEDRPSAPGRSDNQRIVVSASGSYHAQPVTAHLIGGALLSLRDPTDPYDIDFKAANGATHVAIEGTLLDPLHFGGADVELSLQGNDMADLFPLTGIPLPPTPGYSLRGKLDSTAERIRFRDFAGTVGSSDLEGEVSYLPHPPRPDVTMDLRSRKVLLADLGGLIGTTPGKANAPNETAKQQAQRQQQRAKPTLLPDRPINLPKLRAADLHARYKGEQLITDRAPLDDIVAVLDIVDGKVDVHPLSFGVGGGEIAMNIALDGQEQQVHAVADIDATGNSLKAMLGDGDGGLKLFMTGGDLSALLVDLAGLDLGNAAFSALGLPKRADLRCMIADFGLKDGELDTRTLLVDTTEANLIGSGSIDLKQEQVDYKLRTEPKHFNIGSVHTPILIRGPLKSPEIAPDAKSLTARGAAAVALGVLLTPLAALIPTIQLGLGEDNDCVALLKTVGAPPAPPPTSGKANHDGAK